MHRIVAAITCCLLLVWTPVRGTAQAPHFDGNQTIASGEPAGFVTYIAADPVNVVASKPAGVTLRFKVADGLHINSHTPHTKELIPTQLAVAEMPGLNVASVEFPAGTEYSFSFMPKEKLSVYAGEFVLHAHLTARRGDYPVHALLRYQACDSTTCYPPKTVPVLFEVVAK